MNANSSSTVLCAAAGKLSALRMIVEDVAPHVDRRPPRPARIHPRRRRGEVGLCLPQLALSDRQQRRGRRVDQFLGAISRLDVRRADGVGVARAGKNLRLQLRRVVVDGLARLFSRGLQAVLRRPIGHVSERQRQIVRDEIGGATEHDDGAIHEDPRRIRQVHARGREEPRHRGQLRRGLLRP